MSDHEFDEKLALLQGEAEHAADLMMRTVGCQTLAIPIMDSFYTVRNNMIRERERMKEQAARASAPSDLLEQYLDGISAARLDHLSRVSENLPNPPKPTKIQ